MALNGKQTTFVSEYLIDQNATQAAIRAGYSPKTAGATGHENLKKPEIAAAIAEAQAERLKRNEITADMVLQELRKIGFSDIRKAVAWGSRLVEREGGAPEGEAYFLNDVSLVDSAALDDDTAAAIAEVAQTKDGVRIKFHDKKGALVDIGKHLGMFTERVEHTGNVILQLQPLDDDL